MVICKPYLEERSTGERGWQGSSRECSWENGKHQSHLDLPSECVLPGLRLAQYQPASSLVKSNSDTSFKFMQVLSLESSWMFLLEFPCLVWVWRQKETVVMVVEEPQCYPPQDAARAFPVISNSAPLVHPKSTCPGKLKAPFRKQGD